jgi:hypothetical protein
MRIGFRLVTMMRIRILVPKMMRIYAWIRFHNTDPVADLNRLSILMPIQIRIHNTDRYTTTKLKYVSTSEPVAEELTLTLEVQEGRSLPLDSTRLNSV